MFHLTKRKKIKETNEKGSRKTILMEEKWGKYFTIILFNFTINIIIFL